MILLRLTVLTFAAALGTGAFSLAGAQTAADDPVTLSSADVPVASDAIPDWYQRFSGSESETGLDVWTGTTETDVQLNFPSSPRWNLQLGLTSREGEIGVPREEMWAGATYNITSRLSIGGSVGVGSDELGPGAEWGEQRLETGIRLQSAFKF